jgi:hypothetical protein
MVSVAGDWNPWSTHDVMEVFVFYVPIACHLSPNEVSIEV